MKAILVPVVVFCAGLAIASPGWSADVAPLAPEAKVVESPTGWTITAAPYFWAAGISGDTAQFGLPEVHIDSSFSDILQNLDFAFMGAGEARYDRYSIFGDIIYTKLGATGIRAAGFWLIASM